MCRSAQPVAHMPSHQLAQPIVAQRLGVGALDDVEIGRDAGSPWISGLHPLLAFSYWPYAYFLIWRPLREAGTSTASEADPVVTPALAS